MTTALQKPRTSLPVVAPRHDAGIDYELFLDCVHCGLCTSSCPTYLELGTEMDSPRGRIYLMRAVTDGRLDLTALVQRHLDLCLNCRACESACPSGVQYGKLIEPFRVHLQKTMPQARTLPFWQRLLLFHVTPYNWRTRLALAPARLLQWTGLDRLLEKSGLLKYAPGPVRRLQEMLPPLAAHHGGLPEFLPAQGKRRARVALFVGCAGDAFFPQTTLNTARVLERNGCDVWVPRGQVCCGALHYHSALDEPARQFAARNCAAFRFPAQGQRPAAELSEPAGELSEPAGELSEPAAQSKGEDCPGSALRAPSGEECDAIVVNAAGCGAMLKDYGQLLHKTASAPAGDTFAGKVRDITEFLVQLGPVQPEHPLPFKKAVYHDACHLCHAQQIRTQPRQLLEMIPGLQLLPLNESEICCGAAGSYNITEPEMAERLGERKAKNILDTGAEAVFAGNVGCLIQIGRYLRKQRPGIWVGHPVDALWASYNGSGPDD